MEGQVFFLEGLGMGWAVSKNKNSCRENATGKKIMPGELSGKNRANAVKRGR